ncbi:AIR carboxylase family protein [uncultured Varibaculum sp.]|uniref:AIR carboxylase family protein n=1 Tax=uncultured Varibaculum sp. TaxID=413896 RepID=UPI0034A4722E
MPVSTVGINNSYNAAMTAVEIIGTSNRQVAAQLKEYRENMKKKFTAEPINF